MQYRSDLIPDPDLLDSFDGTFSVKKFVIDLLETILLTLLMFGLINAVSSRIRVESVSMQDTLQPGDFVFVNKLAYLLGDVNRGDVIVFEPPFPSPEPFIKRVIGIEGDEIVVKDGEVYINGHKVIEPYIKSNTTHSGKWKIPQGYVFVMGDNRRNSNDSRGWGLLPIDNIQGKALFVYWPPLQWGALTERVVAADGNIP